MQYKFQPYQKQPDMKGCIGCNLTYMVINKAGKTKSQYSGMSA